MIKTHPKTHKTHKNNYGRTCCTTLPCLRGGFPRQPPKASPRVPKVSPRLAKASTKALPLRPEFSKVSTKALPQAFRRLIVLSGCSILLLTILTVVPFWRFFQFAPSWHGVQNDLFKRSSQVVPVGGSFLKFHHSCIVHERTKARRLSSFFFVHCTKAL